jgi:hypothetical protein
MYERGNAAAYERKKTGACTFENSEKNAFTAWRLMEVMVVWQRQS